MKATTMQEEIITIFKKYLNDGGTVDSVWFDYIADDVMAMMKKRIVANQESHEYCIIDGSDAEMLEKLIF